MTELKGSGKRRASGFSGKGQTKRGDPPVILRSVGKARAHAWSHVNKSCNVRFLFQSPGCRIADTAVPVQYPIPSLVGGSSEAAVADQGKLAASATTADGEVAVAFNRQEHVVEDVTPCQQDQERTRHHRLR